MSMSWAEVLRLCLKRPSHYHLFLLELLLHTPKTNPEHSHISRILSSYSIHAQAVERSLSHNSSRASLIELAKRFSPTTFSVFKPSRWLVKEGACSVVTLSQHNKGSKARPVRLFLFNDALCWDGTWPSGNHGHLEFAGRRVETTLQAVREGTLVCTRMYITTAPEGVDGKSWAPGDEQSQSRGSVCLEWGSRSEAEGWAAEISSCGGSRSRGHSSANAWSRTAQKLTPPRQYVSMPHMDLRTL